MEASLLSMLTNRCAGASWWCLWIHRGLFPRVGLSGTRGNTEWSLGVAELLGPSFFLQLQQESSIISVTLPKVTTRLRPGINGAGTSGTVRLVVVKWCCCRIMVGVLVVVVVLFVLMIDCRCRWYGLFAAVSSPSPLWQATQNGRPEKEVTEKSINNK